MNQYLHNFNWSFLHCGIVNILILYIFLNLWKIVLPTTKQVVDSYHLFKEECTSITLTCFSDKSTHNFNFDQIISLKRKFDFWIKNDVLEVWIKSHFIKKVQWIKTVGSIKYSNHSILLKKIGKKKLFDLFNKIFPSFITTISFFKFYCWKKFNIKYSDFCEFFSLRSF